jgi:hypothetical protein
MVDIAVYFNWTYVSLVYSADEYGEMGADAFKKQARRMNICIAIEERIGKKEALKESVDNLLQKYVDSISRYAHMHSTRIKSIYQLKRL